MIDLAKLTIEKTGEGRLRLMLGDAVFGFLGFREYPHTKGWQFIPGFQRRTNRVLRTDLRETLMKTVKLPAAIADRLIASLEEAAS